MMTIEERLGMLHAHLKETHRKLREAREAWAVEEMQLEHRINILTAEVKAWEEAYWREFAGTIHS
jgi:DNA-binding transcriptional regulator YiaG